MMKLVRNSSLSIVVTSIKYRRKLKMLCLIIYFLNESAEILYSIARFCEKIVE